MESDVISSVRYAQAAEEQPQTKPRLRSRNTNGGSNRNSNGRAMVMAGGWRMVHNRAA
jgi:hypothetical protein